MDDCYRPRADISATYGHNIFKHKALGALPYDKAGRTPLERRR